jgi:hypothetical protein
MQKSMKSSKSGNNAVNKTGIGKITGANLSQFDRISGTKK